MGIHNVKRNISSLEDVEEIRKQLIKPEASKADYEELKTGVRPEMGYEKLERVFGSLSDKEIKSVIIDSRKIVFQSEGI